MNTNLGSAGNVLLCLHYGIGDVVMQLPVIRSLRRHLPNARVTALGARPAVQLVADCDGVDASKSVQEWGLGHWYDEGTPQIKAALSDWLREERFDLILDVSHAVRAIRNVIWSVEGRWTILDSDPSRYVSSLRSGASAMCAAVAAGWGIAVEDGCRAWIQIGDPRREWAARLRKRHHPTARTLIGLSPVASSPLKRWPVERLAAVAAALIGRLDCGVVVFGGNQRSLADQLADRLSTLTTVTTLRAVHLLHAAALLRHCALLICNDTGLMHMAAAVDTPVAALFGPSSAEIYLPPAPQARALTSGVTCPHRNTQSLGPSACILKGRCLIGRRSCIDAIRAEDVEAVAERMIGARAEGYTP